MGRWGGGEKIVYIPYLLPLASCLLPPASCPLPPASFSLYIIKNLVEFLAKMPTLAI
jgi:hypothetical protein